MPTTTEHDDETPVPTDAAEWETLMASALERVMACEDCNTVFEPDPAKDLACPGCGSTDYKPAKAAA